MGTVFGVNDECVCRVWDVENEGNDKARLRKKGDNLSQTCAHTCTQTTPVFDNENGG